MMRHVYALILLSLFLVIALWVLYFGLQYTQEPLRALPEVEETVPTIVEAGEHLRITSSFARDFSCTVVILRRVYDSNGSLIITDMDTILARDDPNNIVIDKYLQIPLGTAEGRAVLRRYVQWECNWLQRIFPRSREMQETALQIQ